MWWHGGAGLIERSERGSLSAVATHDVFGFLVSFGCVVRLGISLGNLRIIEATAETVSNVYNPIQNLGMVEQLVSAGNNNQMHAVLVGMTKVDLESRIKSAPNQLPVIQFYLWEFLLEAVNHILAGKRINFGK